MKFLTGELISISLTRKDKYGIYLICILNEISLGKYSCKVTMREWPLQHLNILIGSQLEFIPIAEGMGWLLPLNNQNQEVFGELISNLLKSGASRFEKEIETCDLQDPDKDSKNNKELHQKRKDLEKLFSESNEGENEDTESEDGEDQGDLPF